MINRMRAMLLLLTYLLEDGKADPESLECNQVSVYQGQYIIPLLLT